MAKTFTAPFAQTPKTGSAVCTGAAVITTDSPTNTVLIGTAGADGAILTKVSAIPRATVTASGLYLFISKDSGTTKRLIDSETMAAWTAAATEGAPETLFANITESNAVRLEAGDQLYVAAAVASAEGIVFHVEWTDF